MLYTGRNPNSVFPLQERGSGFLSPTYMGKREEDEVYCTKEEFTGAKRGRVRFVLHGLV